EASRIWSVVRKSPVWNEGVASGLNFATTLDWPDPVIVPDRKLAMVTGVWLGNGGGPSTKFGREMMGDGVLLQVTLPPGATGPTTNSPSENEDGAVYWPEATLLNVMPLGPVVPVRTILPDVL